MSLGRSYREEVNKYIDPIVKEDLAHFGSLLKKRSMDRCCRVWLRRHRARSFTGNLLQLTVLARL